MRKRTVLSLEFVDRKFTWDMCEGYVLLSVLLALDWFLVSLENYSHGNWSFPGQALYTKLTLPFLPVYVFFTEMDL